MKVVVAGAGGKMGRALIEAVLADPSLKLGAALDVATSPAIGSDAGGVRVSSDAGAAIKAGDVLIDFTCPAGTLAYLDVCVAAGKSMVIGTTGLSAEERERIAQGARKIPIVMAPNFAVGVNAVFRLAETAAKILGDAYDVEIVEAHHRSKVDAPSGTALQLGEVIAKTLGRDLASVAIYGRQGESGARPVKQIGFHAIRGGDIVGEHTVIFAGSGERVEIAVRSQSRSTYAMGALRAAKWLRDRAPGLYDMRDVLGLK